jgi:hypothetical protein
MSLNLKQTRLVASTLSRVWEMWKNEDRSFAILTAFRGEYDLEENIRRNLALAADVRAKGYGYHWLDGYFIENKGTPEEKKVEEDSLFVSAPKGKSENLKKDVMALLAEYKQEMAVFKPEKSNGEVFLLSRSGEMISIGKSLLPNQIAENYSELRNGKGTFVFAAALVRRTNLEIQALLKNYPTISKVIKG